MLLLHYYSSQGGGCTVQKQLLKKRRRTEKRGLAHLGRRAAPAHAAARSPGSPRRPLPALRRRQPPPLAASHVQVEDAHVREGEEDLVDEVDTSAVLGDKTDQETHHDPPPVQLFGPRHPAQARPDVGVLAGVRLLLQPRRRLLRGGGRPRPRARDVLCWPLRLRRGRPGRPP